MIIYLSVAIFMLGIIYQYCNSDARHNIKDILAFPFCRIA